MSAEADLDPRVLRTRALLMEALMELLGQKTLQSITVQDITQAAHINRSTFYAHFEDKFALFDALIQETFHEAMARRVSPSADFSPDNLRLLVIAVCEFLEMHNRKCSPAETQFRSMIEAQIQAQLYERILEWIEPQRSVASAEVTASMISWAIFGVGLHWSQGGSSLDLQAVADHVMSLLTEGALVGQR